MSPPVFPCQNPAEAYKGISIPSLFIRGTEDDGIVGETQAWQRRIPFDHASSESKYLVTLFGADHMVYSGHFLESRSEDDNYYQALICRISTLFLDAHLQKDAVALQILETAAPPTIVQQWGIVEKCSPKHLPKGEVSQQENASSPPGAVSVEDRSSLEFR
jgi:hypothetical protein